MVKVNKSLHNQPKPEGKEESEYFSALWFKVENKELLSVRLGTF